jgi:hypothetical protein
VHVHTGGSYKRRPMVICVKGSIRDQEVDSAWELEDPKTGKSTNLVEVGVCVRWYQSLQLFFL